MSWTRSPLLHFLVFGAILFAAQRWLAANDPADQPAASIIEIEPSRLEELSARFQEQMGRRPESGELERMIAQEVDEEILFREAVERGLLERDGGVQTRLIQKMLFLEGKTTIDDAGALLERAAELELEKDDIVVRRILVQKMRLLGSALSEAQAVSEADIAARYAKRREALRAPDRRSLVHVFLSSDRRPGRAASDARDLQDRLEREAVAPAAAIALGDPFPLGHDFAQRSERDLARTFGARFGPAVFALPARTWSGPIPSAYGQHLIWIEAASPGQVPPLPEVSDRIRREIEQERREEKLTTLLSELRKRYEVVVRTPQEPG